MSLKNRLIATIFTLVLGISMITVDPITADAATKPVTTTAAKNNTAMKKQTLYVGKTAAQRRQANLARWMKTCDNMLKNMRRYGFRYSNSCATKTYRSAVRGSRKTNCALFVSWCLQEYGAIARGNKFYMQGGIHKNFDSWGPKVKVFYVGKRCYKTKLQKGDVVCWTSASHVNVFAGYSKSGKRLWYDGGKVATATNSNGSRYVHTGPRHHDYLDGRKIGYIIRIKF